MKMRCKACGKVFSGGTTCPVCGSSDVESIPEIEVFLTKPVKVKLSISGNKTDILNILPSIIFKKRVLENKNTIEVDVTPSDFFYPGSVFLCEVAEGLDVEIEKPEKLLVPPFVNDNMELDESFVVKTGEELKFGSLVISVFGKGGKI